MNSKQKAVRTLGICVLALMALFPPWKLLYTEPDGTKVSVSIGYRPVWFREAPESEGEDNRENLRHQVNVTRLCIQLGVVLILMNAGVYLLKAPRI